MSKTFKCALLVALALASAGCAKKVDLEASRASLKAVEAQWSNAADNADSFVSFFAPDGALLPPNEPAVSGAENLHAWATRMMGMPGFSVSWQTNVADVSKSGDLGYTSGTYKLSMQGPDGEPISDHGKYLTVWRKDKTGAWKAVFDTFNSDVAMAPAEPAEEPYPNDK